MNKVEMIKSLSFRAYNITEPNTKSYTTNSQKLEQDLMRNAALGQSQINFKGRLFNINKKDLLFLSTLTASFGLSAEYLDKLKQTLSEFLSDNNFKSMDELAGKNYIPEQVDLAEKLRAAMDFNDDNADDAEDRLSFIMDMVIERCEAGENYFPEINDFKETAQIKKAEEVMLGENIKRYIKMEKDNDERLINTLSTTFELDNDDKKKLREIIDTCLKDNKVISLKQFRNYDESDAIVAYLAGIITDEFGLSDYDNILISAEIIERIMADDGYIPKLNPLDRNEEISRRDKTVFMEILDGYNIDLQTQENLYFAMKEDAYKNKYSSILDLFSNGKDINQYKVTNSVLNSPELYNYKTDLVIDFHLALKNLEAIQEKQRAKEYAAKSRYSKQSAIICLLEKQCGLTQNSIEKLLNYFKTQKLDYSDANDSWKAAYDISDLLNISGKQVNEIIKKINSMDEDELDEYNFKLSKLIISKITEA